MADATVSNDVKELVDLLSTHYNDLHDVRTLLSATEAVINAVFPKPSEDTERIMRLVLMANQKVCAGIETIGPNI